MKLLYFGFFLAIGCLAVNACTLDQATIIQYATSCMRGNLKLSMEIASHIGNPKALESSQFLCRYKSEIANLFVCMEHHLAECMPQQSRMLMAIMPSHDSLLKGFNLLCEHRDIMDSECFSTQMTSFMQCYMGRLKSPDMRSLASVNNPQKILCNVIRAEERCFEEHRGSCSEDFIAMVIDVLETVFPMKHCPANPTVNRLMDLIAKKDNSLRFRSMRH